jgi:anti-sigma factor RsiW
MINEHPSAELLVRHLDGELTPEALPALERHLAACALCRGRSSALQAASGVVQRYSANLLDAPDAAAQRRTLLDATARREAMPAAVSGRRIQIAAAIAACLVLTVSAVLVMSRQPKRSAVVQPPMAGDVFISLPYSDDNLSGEGAVVLQVEIPRSAVALAGMPVVDGPANGRVRAEVMVGADGLARAIRFLN